MSGRPAGVCLIQVPPVVAGRAGTGAQVVAGEVVRALAGYGEVTILHGYTENTPPRPRRIAAGVTALPAFPITPRTLRGAIAPDLTPPAERALAAARLVVTAECALADAPAAPRLACLGGYGYLHTFDLVGSGAWERLVVPSEYLAELVRRRVPDPASVSVIPNGIDTDTFRPGTALPGARERITLLVPGRPEASKGLGPALDLARALAAGGTPVVVRCLRTRRGTGDGALLDGLRQRRAGVDVQVLPWHPREAMPDLYRRADLTVCFSGVPEGFGLTAVESVACGTPVLAWPAGALAELLPAGHGLVLAERDATPQEWAAAAERAVAVGARDCERGRRYIREHYDAALMADRYRALAGRLLDEA